MKHRLETKHMQEEAEMLAKILSLPLFGFHSSTVTVAKVCFMKKVGKTNVNYRLKRKTNFRLPLPLLALRPAQIHTCHSI